MCGSLVRAGVDVGKEGDQLAPRDVGHHAAFPAMSSPKIYLAGPLFTTPEREFNVQLATRLRTAGHEVFVPQENPASERTGKAIFLKDLEGLD